MPTHNEAASPTLKALLPAFSHRSPSREFVEQSMSTERNQQKAAQKTATRSAILVRGHTGKLRRSAHSVRSIATLISGALPSWSGLDVNNITVKDVSGQGGSRAFKVSSGCDVTPPIVALHSRSTEVSTDPVSERRAAAAAAAMQDAGVAPARLAAGGDWYIVAWGGTELGWHRRPAGTSPEDVGRLLARVHTVPTDWWTPFEAELLQHIPQLARAAPGSCPWWFSARTSRFELKGTSFDWKHVTAEAVEAWAQASPKPASAIGARLVTSHGDFHGKNILRSADASLRVIDFEFSGVFEAALDLGYAFVTQSALLRTAASKRAFVRAYIEETTGQAASTDDVEALAVDAEAATLACPLFSPLAAWVYFDDPKRYQRMVADTIRNVIDEARGDAALREKLLAKGALRFAPGWWMERSFVVATSCMCCSSSLGPMQM